MRNLSHDYGTSPASVTCDLTLVDMTHFNIKVGMAASKVLRVLNLPTPEGWKAELT